MYIPGGWSHAVVNIGEISIALAVELGWNMQFLRRYDESVSSLSEQRVSLSRSKTFLSAQFLCEHLNF